MLRSAPAKQGRRRGEPATSASPRRESKRLTATVAAVGPELQNNCTLDEHADVAARTKPSPPPPTDMRLAALVENTRRSLHRRRPTPACVCPTCDLNAILNPVIIIFGVSVALVLAVTVAYWWSRVPERIAEWRARWDLYAYAIDALVVAVSFVAVAVGLALTRGTETVEVQEQAVAAFQVLLNANQPYSNRILYAFHPWLGSPPPPPPPPLPPLASPRPISDGSSGDDEKATRSEGRHDDGGGGGGEWSATEDFLNRRVMFESVAYDILFATVDAWLGTGAVPTADNVHWLQRAFGIALTREAWRSKRVQVDTSTQLFIDANVCTCVPDDGDIADEAYGIVGATRAGEVRPTTPSSSPRCGRHRHRGGRDGGGSSLDVPRRTRDCALGGCCAWRGAGAGCGCLCGTGTCCYGCDRNALLHPVSVAAFIVLALTAVGTAVFWTHVATHATPEGVDWSQQWQVYLNVLASLLLVPTLLLVIYAYVDTQHQTDFADTLGFVALRTQAYDNYPQSVAFYRQLNSYDAFALRVRVPPPPRRAAARHAYAWQQRAFVATYSETLLQAQSSDLQVDTLPNSGKRARWRSYWLSPDYQSVWLRTHRSWPTVLRDYVHAHYWSPELAALGVFGDADRSVCDSVAGVAVAAASDV